MFVVVEQDMYPVQFDVPKPIAQRTRAYLRDVGIGAGPAMTVKVGVIGTGMIGQDHIRRITEVIPGGRVAAVTDVDLSRAGQVAAGLPGVRRPPDRTGSHSGQRRRRGACHVLGRDARGVRARGDRRRQAGVLARNRWHRLRPAAMRIVDGRDGGRAAAGPGRVHAPVRPWYDALKDALDAGAGAPLLMHCAHRNPSVPPYGFTTDMIISDSAVHEIDLVRWLFDEEIVATSVRGRAATSRAPEGLQDP